MAAGFLITSGDLPSSYLCTYDIVCKFLFFRYNLTNEPKKKGEASAYSVFNPNCEQIDGTFTAEQFERELLYKM